MICSRCYAHELCSLSPQGFDARADELDDVLRRRARHVVTDSARAVRAAQLLSTGGLRSVGALFEASHRSMRDDYKITAPTVDLIQRTAVESGAIGARMTVGFGGSVIAMVEKGSGPTVLARCIEASRLAGHPTPTAFVASAGDGARRLD